MHSREVQHLLNLCCCHVFGINATHAMALRVYLKHDSGRLFTVFVKELLQNLHYKFHWCEIVIQ